MLILDSLHEQCQAFAQMPTYTQCLLEINPDAYINFFMDEETGHFPCLLICPSQSRESFRHCRRFIAIDGTFLKSKFRQTLLLAVSSDTNGNNLLLA